MAEFDGTIAGHFLFSRFPQSNTPDGGHGNAKSAETVMLAPVSVHADYFYNQVGFRTSADYGIYPVSGWPMDDPRGQMCMETVQGSLRGTKRYVVYDMYYNA